MRFVETKPYRKDIDGLRAIAVLAVIFFHFGFLPNGYLGVDVFFVISGFLITGIISRELNEDRFSIARFYVRRTRRILPLSLFIGLVSLLVGLVVMLPDDLDNLAQSIVATNLFSNNVLQAITTRNYWDVVNEFKPLMHTWSLGVEEQYYVVYPLLLLLIGKHHRRWLLPTLAALAIASLALYLSPFAAYAKFYYLPFRFFELAVGGIASLYLKDKLLVHNYAAALVFGLIAILCVELRFLPAPCNLLAAVVLALGVIVTDNSASRTAAFVLQNRLAVALGLVSFSLYMWHQIVLSYFRYFVVQKIEVPQLAIIFCLILALSALTYFAIERPFRDAKRIGVKTLFATIGLLFTLTTFPSLYLYKKGGIIRDVPEMGMSRTTQDRNPHVTYNRRVHRYNQPFSDASERVKVLVIGNSFARDWANVLLESKHRDSIEVSYVVEPAQAVDFPTRAEQADLIFCSEATRDDVARLHINDAKLYVVGTKNFGINSGYFYNYTGEDYYSQRTPLEHSHLELNERLKRQWGDRYIDLIGAVLDKRQTVPVFTAEKKFISRDCRHFTQSGASYYSGLLENDLASMLDGAKVRR